MYRSGLSGSSQVAWYQSNITVAAIGLATFLTVWELSAHLGIYNARLFPPPSAIAQTWWRMALSGELLTDVAASLRRAAIGFFFAAVAGVSLGLATGSSRWVNAFAGTIVQVLRPVPAVAMVPFAILWFGLGETSKCFLVFWGAFHSIWINTHLGVRQVDKRLTWAALSLGANRRQLVLRILLPGALGNIVAGMRTGIAIAFICLVAAEMAGAFAGLGYRIEASHLVFRADRMLAALATLGALGAIVDAGFAGLVNWLMPWYRAGMQGET